MIEHFVKEERYEDCALLVKIKNKIKKYYDKQTELLLKTAQGKETQALKEQKAEADRLSKQQMKALDMLSKLTAEENRVQIEADKIESQEKMKALDVLNDMTKQETINIKKEK